MSEHIQGSQRFAHYTSLYARAKERFGDESLMRLGLALRMSAEPSVVTEGTFGGFALRNLTTCLEYSMKLEPSEFSAMLDVLMLSSWPYTGTTKIRHGVLAAAIQADMVPEFLTAIRTFNSEQQAAAEKKKPGKSGPDPAQVEQCKQGFVESIISNPSLHRFLSLLPVIKTMDFYAQASGDLTNIWKDGERIQIDSEAFHLAWAGGLGAPLMGLCSESMRLPGVERFLKTATQFKKYLTGLSGRYYQATIQCAAFRALKGYFDGGLDEESLRGAFSSLGLELTSLSPTEATFKQPDGLKVTVPKDSIQTNIDAAEDNKMRYRMRMGLAVKIVMDKLGIQLPTPPEQQKHTEPGS